MMEASSKKDRTDHDTDRQSSIIPRGVKIAYGGIEYAAATMWTVCAMFELIWAIMPDVVEVDELKTGRWREGLYYGAYLFATKAASALALFLVGQALHFSGYVANGVQPESALWSIRIIYGPGVGILLLCSVAIAFFFPITRRRHKAMIQAIEAKKSGAPWDEKSVRSLL